MFMRKVEERVIIPTVNGIKKEKIDYKGFIFIGLMNVNGEPYVIEYNVRMGDPETEVVMPRIKSDLVEAMVAAADGTLADVEFELDMRTAATVVMVAGGYPGNYLKGDIIHGLNYIAEDTIVFHAGTKINNGNTVTNGGRVLAVTGMGNDMQDALHKSYAMVAQINWKDAYFRKDIGRDLMALE